MRSIVVSSSSVTPSSSSARSQSIASAMPGGFWMSLSRITATAATTLCASPSETPPTRRRTMSSSRCLGGIVEPLVQAAPLDRVVQVARAVGREHDHRRELGADGAELRDRHRRLREQLEQERLEVVVGAVDLVDQQHRRPRARVLQGPQQRPRDQVLAAEQVALAQLLAGRLGQPDRQQLARIVPLVQRLGGVDAVVALQPDQRRVQRQRQRLGGLGLAYPRLPLQQQRLREAEREEQRRRQPFVDEVVDGGQAPRERLDIVAASSSFTGAEPRSPASPPTRGRACTACRCDPRRAAAARR